MGVNSQSLIVRFYFNGTKWECHGMHSDTTFGRIVGFDFDSPWAALAVLIKMLCRDGVAVNSQGRKRQ